MFIKILGHSYVWVSGSPTWRPYNDSQENDMIRYSDKNTESEKEKKTQDIKLDDSIFI